MSRVVGGHCRVDLKSGRVERDLMDPRRIPNFQEIKSTQRLAKFHQTEKLRAKKKQPHRIPPLKLSNMSSTTTDDMQTEQKNRNRNQDNKTLALAIKEAVEMKKEMKNQPETVYNKHPKHPPLPKVMSHKKKEQKLLLAGEKCNETQARLSDSSAFIGVQKYGKMPNRLFNGQGDMSRHPNGKVKQMLATTNGDTLNIPARSADFRYEVDWRLGLRQL